MVFRVTKYKIRWFEREMSLKGTKEERKEIHSIKETIKKSTLLLHCRS